MRKLFLLFALMFAASIASSQVDMRLNNVGPITDICRACTWTGSGTGAVNNNFIFTPFNSSTGVCLYIRNNDSSQHQFTLKVLTNGDQQVNNYIGNTSAWTGALLNRFTFSPLDGSFIWNSSGIAANATLIVAASTSGAANVVISISGGSGSGTATVTSVQGTCGNFSSFTSMGTISPILCDQTFSSAVSPSTTVTVGGNNVGTVYVCSYEIITTSVITTLASVSFGMANPTCSTPSAFYQTYPGGTAVGAATKFGGSGMLFVNGGGFSFFNYGIGKSLCFTNNDATGALLLTVQFAVI